EPRRCSVRPGQLKAFAVRDVTQPGKKGRSMNGRTTAGLSMALGLWLSVAAARADDCDWSPTSAPPAVVRAREVIASTRPAATLGRPRIVVEPGPPAVTPASYEPIARTDLRPKYRGQAPDPAAPPSGAALARAPPP